MGAESKRVNRNYLQKKGKRNLDLIEKSKTTDGNCQTVKA